jgi:hypothetical protein
MVCLILVEHEEGIKPASVWVVRQFENDSENSRIFNLGVDTQYRTGSGAGSPRGQPAWGADSYRVPDSTWQTDLTSPNRKGRLAWLVGCELLLDEINYSLPRHCKIENDLLADRFSAGVSQQRFFIFSGT